MPLEQQQNAPQLFKKQTGLTWARSLYVAALAAALVFVVPTDWFPFQLGKIAVFAALLLLSVTVFSLSGGWKIFWRASGNRTALLAAALPLVYIVSAYVAHSLPTSFLGTEVEADTVVFAALLFCSFIFSFALFRTPRSAWLLVSVVFYSLVAAVAFQLIDILVGTSLMPLAFFADHTTNLLGKWNDLGIAAGLLLLIAVIRLEFSSLTRMKTAFLLLVAAAALVLLAIINFSFIWGLLIVSIVFILIVKLLQTPLVSQEDRVLTWRHHVPWFGLSTAVALGVCLFFGNGLNAKITSMFPVNAVEVRPSFSATMEVVTAGRADSAQRLFLGTGPATFGTTWLMHKPEGVNQSTFWNLDFIIGFSTVVAALGTVGVLGVIAWMIAPFLVIFALLRAFRTSLFKSRERVLAMVLATSSLFLSCSFVFYNPGQNLLLLTFTMLGSAFGFLWRSAQKERDMEEVQTSPLATLGRGIFAGLLLILVFACTVAVERRTFSETELLQGQAALSKGQTEAALLSAGKAEWFEATPNTKLLKFATGFAKLQQIATDTSLPAQTAQERFTKTLTETIAAGKEATTNMPKDYRAHFMFGNLYYFLSSLKVPGAYENARTSYQTAATYNPKNPEIPLALARLEASQDKRTLAEAALQQSLTLKPNYTDAILFVVQLNVADNDIPSAIRAATAAAQTAPGVAAIWFQLGLLYYTNGSMQNAVDNLQKALTITPDYANAQYFLGLAYYKQKRGAEAIKLFETLQKNNPENAELALILANMRAGKDAFDGAKPPVTNSPETRTTAPVAE